MRSTKNMKKTLIVITTTFYVIVTNVDSKRILVAKSHLGKQRAQWPVGEVVWQSVISYKRVLQPAAGNVTLSGVRTEYYTGQTQRKTPRLKSERINSYCWAVSWFVCWNMPEKASSQWIYTWSLDIAEQSKLNTEYVSIWCVFLDSSGWQHKWGRLSSWRKSCIGPAKESHPRQSSSVQCFKKPIACPSPEVFF